MRITQSYKLVNTSIFPKSELPVQKTNMKKTLAENPTFLFILRKKMWQLNADAFS